MSESIEKAINEQINEELFSSYLYLAIAADAGSRGLSGIQSWMTVQAQEEVAHAMKFYNFVLERGGKVELKEIAKPEKEFGSVLDMFKASLKHEKHITGCIHKLYELAEQEKDYPFVSFLKWFIDEQVEEEASAQEVIDKIEMIGDNSGLLYALDKELGQRKLV
jgi:ferritin